MGNVRFEMSYIDRHGIERELKMLSVEKIISLKISDSLSEKIMKEGN